MLEDKARNDQRQFNWRTHVIAIDFDGCLCQSDYPEIGEPNEEVISEAIRLRGAGACIILWTCRAGEELEAAVEACRGWGLEFDAINENPKFMIDLYHNDCRKVEADEYWDDRSVFMGSPQWRNIRGSCCMSRSRAKIRQLMDEAIRPEIELAERLAEKGAAGEKNEWYGVARTLQEAMEDMELMMAALDEQNSAHDWYRTGYQDATKNAASWVTDFIQGMPDSQRKGVD